MTTKLEQNHQTAIASGIKQADVLLENMDSWQHLAIDVTVISSFRGGLVPGAAPNKKIEKIFQVHIQTRIQVSTVCS